ncbi:hypothetical protein CA267_016905 [Alteromonas pelagimontana]|uniref:Uncharacterized protein n=1 Tax=Alteromonas pelagimontana TaxID=1858656 RepID=A0A6M4MHA6_9ALTE|nr:hypothetical protein [Alteromonas pelagimontana]QJR82308.1 hypothetical protein CA267_016905 [Alteromonas pelagimontana]
MAMFLNKEINAVHHAHQHYSISQRRSDYAVARLKIRTRLFIASPSVLLGFFCSGVFKGLTSSQPSSGKRMALLTFARTAMFKFLT